MRVLFVAGDPGGSRALLPIIGEVVRRGAFAHVVRHGTLGDEFQPGVNATLVDKDVASGLSGAFGKCPDCLVFASSMRDTYPLSLAAEARSLGIPVVHVCDNWSNYALRLMLCGQMLEPDVYCVMDGDAMQDAIAEGVPVSCLVVTGQPALGEAAALYAKFKEKAGVEPKAERRMRIAFIAEPHSSVLGNDIVAPGHCGFTEYQVLAQFCALLGDIVPEAYVLFLCHPKHDRDQVRQAWENLRHSVQGEVIAPGDGRECLARVNGAVGMGSSLLYEAWMYNIPTLILQPNCRWPSMLRFARLSGGFYSGDAGTFRSAAEAWHRACLTGRREAREEVTLHRSAAGRIADLIVSMSKHALRV